VSCLCASALAQAAVCDRRWFLRRLRQPNDTQKTLGKHSANAHASHELKQMKHQYHDASALSNTQHAKRENTPVISSWLRWKYSVTGISSASSSSFIFCSSVYCSLLIHSTLTTELPQGLPAHFEENIIMRYIIMAITYYATRQFFKTLQCLENGLTTLRFW